MCPDGVDITTHDRAGQRRVAIRQRVVERRAQQFLDRIARFLAQRKRPVLLEEGAARERLRGAAMRERSLVERALLPIEVRLRRRKLAEKKVAIVLFGFPPNAGAAGTAGAGS